MNLWLLMLGGGAAAGVFGSLLGRDHGRRQRGHLRHPRRLDPYVAGPTAIGVFLGATAGSRLSHRVDRRLLRLLFVIVLAYTAVQMLLRVVG